MVWCGGIEWKWDELVWGMSWGFWIFGSSCVYGWDGVGMGLGWWVGWVGWFGPGMVWIVGLLAW